MNKRALAALLVVLSLAACGGGGKPKPTAAETAATAQWRAGFVTWGKQMQGAINGISVLESRPADVRGIQSGDPKIAAKLRTYEQTLFGCHATIENLGTTPATFLPARVQALRACADLEQAAAFVRDGIRHFQNGLGPDLLDKASGALTSGQDSVRRAELELDTLS